MKAQFTGEKNQEGRRKFYRYRNNGGVLSLTTYDHLRDTGKGAWIYLGGGEEKWVSTTAKKRFAYPTKEEAMENLKRRQVRRHRLLAEQLYSTEKLLRSIGIEPTPLKSYIFNMDLVNVNPLLQDL